MNVLFITLSNINNIDENGIYQDLMRKLATDNNVFIVSPIEKRFNEKTHLIGYDSFDDWHKNVQILKIKTGNVQKTNAIEKGISMITLESKIKRGLKKFTKELKFDIVLYSTPPITIVKPIKYIVKRDKARTYLMLKDIFPQNAVDLGMLSKRGIKGIIYKFFRKKEKTLYEISDKIGCMSSANIDYLIRNNSNIDKNTVELFPNCIELIDLRISNEEKMKIRRKYDLPLNKKIFVYGGNLGKPQNIDFVIECIDSLKNKNDTYFLIIGNGTEYYKLEKYDTSGNPNFKLISYLQKNEFDRIISSCDYGMIFLDNRFSIPNYPSRLLSYLQAGLPVLACTDVNTDIGDFIVKSKIGVWCQSDNVINFAKCVDFLENDRIDSNVVYNALVNNFNVIDYYKKITESWE